MAIYIDDPIDAQLGIESVGHIAKTAKTTGAGRKALLNYQLSFIPNIVRLPPIRMHDKVRVRDGFSFWPSCRNFFRLHNLLFSDQNFRRRLTKVSAFEKRIIEE